MGSCGFAKKKKKKKESTGMELWPMTLGWFEF
jgi:hypothetical protein